MNTSSAFNARNITAKEIARHFVVPVDFERISSFINMVLVGPRGIGKTTILKTLTPSGLYHLAQRDDLKSELSDVLIDYLPIYIPAETIWKGNAQFIKGTLNNRALSKIIQNGLFVDHCLHEVVSSIQDALKVGKHYSCENVPAWALKMTNQQEEIVCRLCSDLWCLEKIQTSFVGLKIALLKRSNVYRSAVNSFDPVRSENLVRNMEQLDVLVMLKGFFDIMEDTTGADKWSVHFDEMEIAPKHVLRFLYENLRSFDQRVVLKFSLFPYMDFLEFDTDVNNEYENSPVPGQDYHTVTLGMRFANQKFDFPRKILEAECVKYGICINQLKEYLNSSSQIMGGSRIFKATQTERDFRVIYEQASRNGDYSFLEYMKKRGIRNASDIKELEGEAKRAQFVRKVAPIVEIRNYFFSNRDGTFSRRSSKGFGYYHGYDKLFLLTENNPRTLQYYVNDILLSFRNKETSSTAQNNAIRKNVDRYRALIAAQTYSNKGEQTRHISTLKLVDQIGYNLQEELYSPEFKPEPVLSYDLRRVPKEMHHPIITAIHCGALVVEQHEDTGQLTSKLEQCRIRTSHRLAPFYKLPAITGKAKIISDPFKERHHLAFQPDLLSWNLVDE